jgi:lipopolysaccharide export system permease protein
MTLLTLPELRAALGRNQRLIGIDPGTKTIGLALLNLAIVGFIQPYSRYAYEGLRFELRSGALGASIKVGEFTHFGDRMTLRIEQSHDSGRKLDGIFVRYSDKGTTYSVTAQSGQFLATDDPNTIIFRLTNGTLVHKAPNFTVPRVLTFTSHDLPIPLPRYENFRQRGGRNLEFTLPELAKLGHSSSSEEQRDSSRSEFHFRLVEVATMFLLPLLAVALGVPPKRSSSGVGVFLAIVMIVAYHKVNEYAASIGELGRIDPLIALWVPFLIFAGLIIWMYYQIAYVPGGQPIGAIERAFGKIGKAITRYLPGRGRKKGVAA